MPEPATLRVGLLGAGANTRSRHIPGLLAIPGVEIVGVCNRSVESSRRVAQEFGIARAESDPAALLDDPAIDAVVIGTWPDMHCEYTLRALGRGKHVLCEARMARNADEALRMLEASRARPDLVAQVVPAPFTLAFDHVIEAAVATQIGRLVGVRATFHGGTFPDPGTPLHWRRDERCSGQNVMALGIQYEAILRWVGPATRVAAETRAIVDRAPDPATGRERPITVPDHLALVGTLARDGALLEVAMSQVAGFDRTQEVWIYGSEGAVRVDLADAARVFIGTRGEAGLREIDLARHAGPGWRVEQEFVAAIRGQEPVRRTTFEDGVRYMRFTDAVHASMRCGRFVDIQPL